MIGCGFGPSTQKPSSLLPVRLMVSAAGKLADADLL